VCWLAVDDANLGIMPVVTLCNAASGQGMCSLCGQQIHGVFKACAQSCGVRLVFYPKMQALTECCCSRLTSRSSQRVISVTRPPVAVPVSSPLQSNAICIQPWPHEGRHTPLSCGWQVVQPAQWSRVLVQAPHIVHCRRHERDWAAPVLAYVPEDARVAEHVARHFHHGRVRPQLRRSQQRITLRWPSSTA